MKGIKSIKKLGKLYLPELRQVLILMLAGGILGTVIMTGMSILKTDSSAGSVPLGSFIAFSIGICMTMFINTFSFQQKFNMAVSMGCTRKSFFLFYWILNTLFIAAEFLFVLIFALLETGLRNLLHTNSFLSSSTSLIPILTDYRIMTVILLFIPAFGMFLGILLLKFQMKAFWAIWSLWMLCSLTGARVSNYISENHESTLARIASGIKHVLMTMNGSMMLLVIAALSILLFAASALLIRRQAVTQP